MSAKRREKFQDSNALIQLSRQLRAKQAVHEVTTRHIHKDAASKVQQLSQRAASTKRRKPLGAPSDEKALTETLSKRRKTANESLPATLQLSAQVQASPAETVASEQPALAEQVVNNQASAGETLVAATIHQRCLNKQDPFDFVSWYHKVCTQSFAEGLSALQGHDSSHAQPSLISKCIRMNAFAFEAKQAVLQTICQPEQVTPFQHASQWL